jgi:integrase/recombinase XerD
MKQRTRYIFNKEIHGRLKGYGNFLQEIGNSETTTCQKLNYAGYFLSWLESERLLPGDVRYNDLLNFIDYCHLEGNSKRLINSKLRSIRGFYEYLKTKGEIFVNPATSLHVKGTSRKLPSGIMGYPDLESLYQGYPNKTSREKRNKVILGLLVYQGVTTGELHRLETTDVKLKQGKIHVPGTRKSGSRELEMKSSQILEMHEYLEKVRPRILRELKKPRPARKPGKINQDRLKDQLFISINGSEYVKNSLLHMFRGIQKTHPEIRNPKQIRASVITWWLKSYNLRQVQYMAGHKYVSSTERYQLGNLDKLQSRLEKLHPLRDNMF